MTVSEEEILRQIRLRSNARKFFAQFEPRCNRALESVSLICEVPSSGEAIDPELASRATKYLGLALSRESKHHREQMLDSWPASLAVTIGLHAQVAYVHGGFWHNFAHQTNLPENEWRQMEPYVKRVFRRAVRGHNLPWIEGQGGLEYISNVALHSGIPDYCLEDWFRMLEQAAGHAGWGSSAILEWCRAALGRPVLGYVDNPVKYITQHGDQFVLDLADRSVEVLRLARSMARQQVDAEQFAQFGLPHRFAAAAIDWVEKQPRPRAHGTGSTAERGASQPAIEIHPWRQEVVVVLPSVMDPPQGFIWSIQQDEGVAVLVQPMELIGGSRIASAAAEALVAQPVRLIEVQAGVRGHVVGDSTNRTLIRLVDPEEPLLAFDENGRLIDRTSQLPAKPVWLLAQSGNSSTHPSTLEDASIEIDGDARLLDIAESPLGWGDWNLLRVDLSDARSVRLAAGSVRQVAQRRSAVIEVGPVEAAVLVGNTPVCTQRPRVLLPPDFDGEWRIVASASGHTEPYSTMVVDTSMDQGRARKTRSIDPFEGVDGPVIGTFDVRVRGPLGRGARTTVTVVEGLRYASDSRLRLFTKAGLSACTAHLELSGIGLSPAARSRTGSVVTSATGVTLTFLDQDLEIPVLATLETGIQIELTCRPEALAVAQGGPGIIPKWTYRPIRINSDDLATADLRLRIPSQHNPELGLMTGGRFLQSIAPNRTGSRSVNYPLAQLTEAVRKAGSASIELSAGRNSLHLATIAPARSHDTAASEMTPSGPVITLDGFRGGDLEAFVWACGAPWMGPISASPDSDGRISLPSDWSGLEPFVLCLRVRDDWDPEPAPDIPEPLRDTLVWPAKPDARRRIEESGAIGPGRVAALDAQRLWSIIRFKDCLAPFAFPGSQALYPGQVVQSVRRALLLAPDSLAALALATPSTAEAAGLLSLARMETAAACWPAGEDEQHVLTRNPLALALGLSDAAIAGVDVVDRWLILASQLFGDDYEQILTTGVDKNASAGRFDAESDMLDRMPVDQFTEIIRRVNLLPRALLDIDSRTSAALEAFEHRHKYPQNGPLAIQARGLTPDVERELLEGAMDESLVALRARLYPHQPTKWRGLSGASLAWALAARHAAHGELQFLGVIARYPAWSEIPFRMRKLAAIDLVLAEVYAARYEHKKQGTNDRLEDVQ